MSSTQSAILHVLTDSIEGYTVPEFKYTPTNLNCLEDALSSDRLFTYKTLAGNDQERAMKLYVWNTSLGKELYSPIQTFEIALRNALHNQLSSAYGANWFDICRLENRETEQIINAKKYLRKMEKIICSGQIVATISFGFWVGILDRLYENNLWRPYLRHAFKNGPNSLRRKEVFAIVDRVRRLRNRIAHHEPILRYKLDEQY